MENLIQDLDALCVLLKKLRQEVNLLQSLSDEQIDEINGNENSKEINAINAIFDKRETIMKEISEVNSRFNANVRKQNSAEIVKLVQRAFSGEMLHFPTDKSESELCRKIGDVCSLRSDILRGDKATAHKFKRRYSEIHELLAEGTDTKKKIQFYSAYAVSSPSLRPAKGSNMDSNA